MSDVVTSRATLVLATEGVSSLGREVGIVLLALPNLLPHCSCLLMHAALRWPRSSSRSAQTPYTSPLFQNLRKARPPHLPLHQILRPLPQLDLPLNQPNHISALPTPKSNRTHNLPTRRLGVLMMHSILAQPPNPVRTRLVRQHRFDVVRDLVSLERTTELRVLPLDEGARDFAHDRVLHGDDAVGG